MMSIRGGWLVDAAAAAWFLVLITVVVDAHYHVNLWSAALSSIRSQLRRSSELARLNRMWEVGADGSR